MQTAYIVFGALLSGGIQEVQLSCHSEGTNLHYIHRVKAKRDVCVQNTEGNTKYTFLENSLEIE